MVGTDLRKSQPSCCRICIAHYCDCRISSVDFLEAWRFAAASGYFSPPTDRCFAHREAQNYRIHWLPRQRQRESPLCASSNAVRRAFFAVCIHFSVQIMSRNTALTKLTVLLAALVLLTVDANLIFGGMEKMSDLYRSTPKQDVPTREEIAHRAYELYEQRGGVHGRDLEDWLTAERELRNQNLTRVQPAPVAQAQEKRPAISGSRRQSRSKSASAASPAFNNSKPFDTHTTT